MKNPLYTVMMMLVCAFAWGSVFPIAKLILHDMSGLTLSIWRFAIAVVCLALFMYLTGKRLVSLSFKQIIALAVIGAVGVGGLNFALFSGLEQTSAINGALIMALSPIVTAFISAIVNQTRLTKIQLLQLLFAFSGVLLVITGGDLQVLLNFALNRGDLTIVAGMVAWSSYTVCASKVSNWLPPLEFSLVTMAMGLMALCFISLFKAQVHPWQELMASSWFSVACVLYIGVFGTVVGYLCWNNGVKRLGSAKASLYFNLVPVFAAVVSFMMGQSVSTVQITGMLIVLIGLTLPSLINLIFNGRTLSLSSKA